MRSLIQLFKLVFEEKPRLILSFICTLFVALFTYAFINLVQPIMDFMLRMSTETIPDKPRFIDIILNFFNLTVEQLVHYLPWILVGVIFGKGLFTFLSSFLMRSVGLKVVQRMRDDLFAHLVYQSLDYFDHRSTGELMSRVTSDVDRIQEALSGSAKDFIQEIFVFFALLVGVFFIDWHLALMSFVILPLAIIPLAVFSRQLKKFGKLNQIRMAHIFSLLHETLTGGQIVKAFTMEKFEIGKFAEATKNLYRSSLRFAWIGSLSSPFMEFMGGLVGAFILFVGTQRITDGHISTGDFGAFIMALFMMYTPIKRISRANTSLQHGVASLERVQEILQQEPSILESVDAEPLPPIKGKVVFDNVSFSYAESRPALYDVSFEVQPQEMIALVGLSGSGKTTIINLLSRFYDPTSGNIFIDGHDVRDVQLRSLRSQLGLVTQELILFNDSVRNNIAYGLADIQDSKVEAAARAAEAHEFISRLPLGYESQIGEKGSMLSSGQRQRLSIARALLKDPPILILDEATSALDAESETLIQSALSNVMKDRTTFVIAHRLSTIRNANRIFVIDQGRVAEIGTHEELCRLNGIYRKLYDLQFVEKKETKS
ncbi:MAG: ATP-binding cassette domain-containing protein [Candidatus Aminicenantes bacterium]|nr:ATP-binding cassette domain-containing protein [Candidatus Aminicenantes bacterium]